MTGWRWIIAGLALALAAEHADAQASGDIGKGRALAERMCVRCHTVGPLNVPSPNPYSPSFVAIASTLGMTAAALNFILHNYHERMPPIILDAGQTREVAAYILSLKR